MTHSLPWILWLVITLTGLLTTRNPIYLLLSFIILLATGTLLARKRGKSQWMVANLRFLLTMILLSSLINTLFTHTGGTVLFRFPENWLLIGGNITLESLIFGMINGLVIGSLYITFNILNLALSVKQIIRLIPSIFQPLALTITIALTFFPSIQKRAEEIKEAQMIRGNQMKRISDWLPLLMPLLVTSLENAFLLSESMSSRGFHSQKNPISYTFTLVSTIGATFSIFSGWILRLYDYPEIISILLYAFGGLLLLITGIAGNRRSKITHFKQEQLRKSDISATIVLGTILGFWIIFHLFDLLPPFSYSPYPILSIPPLHMSALIFSMTPAVPILYIKND